MELMGWVKAGDEKLVPRLITLDTIPKACNKIVSCSCKSACTTLRCGCMKAKLLCTSSVCGFTINNSENTCFKNKSTS